jgi:CRP-like cAMP-binding protein
MPTDRISQRTRNSARPRLASKNSREFDAQAFLATISEGRKVMLFPMKQTIFTQGESADAMFYLQTGKVRLTVVARTGKEATIGILSDGSFFGEGSLAGQPFRMGTATAMTDCAVLRIEKRAMADTLHREHTLSDLFVAYLLTRNIRYEDKWCSLPKGQQLQQFIDNCMECATDETIDRYVNESTSKVEAHAVLDMLQLQEEQIPGSVLIRRGRNMQTFVVVGRDFIANLNSQEELTML